MPWEGGEACEITWGGGGKGREGNHMPWEAGVGAGGTAGGEQATLTLGLGIQDGKGDETQN